MEEWYKRRFHGTASLVRKPLIPSPLRVFAVKKPAVYRRM
jgi:hypothetical protein